MSKMGETTDRILELLSEKEKLSINELEKEIPLTDIEILNFMKELELIGLKNSEVRITKFGLELLNVE